VGLPALRRIGRRSVRILRDRRTMPNEKILLGIAIGVGCTLAAPFAASIVLPIARPLAKSVLKHSLLAANKFLEELSVAAEGVEDLVAEVRAEVEEHLARRGPSARRRADGPSPEADAATMSERARQGAPS
jgi:hypothetical protein